MKRRETAGSTGAALLWQRGGAFYQISRCGRFTVSGALVNGEWKFTAWHVTPPRSRHNTVNTEILGSCPEAAQARALCEQVVNARKPINTQHLKGGTAI